MIFQKYLKVLIICYKKSRKANEPERVFYIKIWLFLKFEPGIREPADKCNNWQPTNNVKVSRSNYQPAQTSSAFILPFIILYSGSRKKKKKRD